MGKKGRGGAGGGGGGREGGDGEIRCQLSEWVVEEGGKGRRTAKMGKLTSRHDRAGEHESILGGILAAAVRHRHAHNRRTHRLGLPVRPRSLPRDRLGGHGHVVHAFPIHGLDAIPAVVLAPHGGVMRQANEGDEAAQVREVDGFEVGIIRSVDPDGLVDAVVGGGGDGGVVGPVCGWGGACAWGIKAGDGVCGGGVYGGLAEAEIRVGGGAIGGVCGILGGGEGGVEGEHGEHGEGDEGGG